MLLTVSLVALLSGVANGRITFAKSEVLDNVDLKGAMGTANFRCAAGCRVYSPTKNENIIIVNSNGQEDFFSKSLMDLSTLTRGESYELPPSSSGYQLKNYGDANPAFLFYAVEKGAANYFTTVVYIDAGANKTVTAIFESMVTVLSSSGAVHLSAWTGEFARYGNALPIVHTAPFDAIGSCRPVYTASSLPTLPNTAFAVYSPVATINFRETGEDKKVLVTGDYGSSAPTVKDSSSVYSSPGYVGCNSVGDSLYTFLPRVSGINSVTYLNDNGGLAVAVNVEYNIAKEADALVLSVNGQETKLFGKNTISKAYDVGKNANIAVSSSFHEGSKDTFALQIDVTAKDH